MKGNSYLRNFGSRGKLQNLNDICDTLVAAMGTGGGNIPIMEVYKMNNLRIRKLTPKECWRLMGFDDSDFEKAEKVNSNTQLYKQAGNSIVVNVLEKVLGNLIPKNEHIKILELFGGIGACSKALERLGIEYEIADYVEIDKYAVKSFNAIHNTNFEPQDITQYDKDIEVDLIMHGSPCQDFSLAGLQAGGDKGSGTRSSLMYETIRIVQKLKPKYVVWENVKNLLSKKHRHNFDSYLEIMESLGYKNYYQVLNAKDYGIPQNRERVFTISIYQNPEIKVIGNYMPSRHDASRIVDINGIAPTVKENHGTVTAIGEKIQFIFPPKQELKLKLKDMLEDSVDEKYYLSDKMINYISARGTGNFKNPDSRINLDVARPLTTDPNKRAGTTNYLSDDLPDNYNLEEVNRLYGIFDDENSKHQAGSVYDKEGLSPTLDTMQGGYRQPLVEEDTEIKTVFIKNQGTEITRETDVSNTLLARDYKGFGNQEMNAVMYIKNNTNQDNLDDKWSDLD